MMGHITNLVTRACCFQPNLGFCEWGRLDSAAATSSSHRCYAYSLVGCFP